MSTNYGEMERQFLETLKADTGRDVNEWMAAIAAEKLATRNEIIDWLRRQRFTFSKASWLERIHNNGGKPLYENGSSARKTARPNRAAECRKTAASCAPSRRCRCQSSGRMRLRLSMPRFYLSSSAAL